MAQVIGFLSLPWETQTDFSAPILSQCKHGGERISRQEISILDQSINQSIHFKVGPTRVLKMM